MYSCQFPYLYLNPSYEAPQLAHPLEYEDQPVSSRESVPSCWLVPAPLRPAPPRPAVVM